MATTTVNEQKYDLINETLARDDNLLTVSRLVELAGVSRSGYYQYSRNAEKRYQKELKDRSDFELIAAEYARNGIPKGSRSIYMGLLHRGVQMNRKKILRLMAKYNLVVGIRTPNPYRHWRKATEEDRVSPNLLKRRFKAFGPRTLLLTDVTFLFFGRHQVAYLSVIKDAFTNEILAHAVSQSLKTDFVLETVTKLMQNHQITGGQKVLIHSDQGTQYTDKRFRDLVRSHELRQSMSRRANAWDNAPQESFFGHMKDEFDPSAYETFKALKKAVDAYIKYYNNDRYQWNLAKLAPTEYHKFIITGQYPLAAFLPTPAVPSWRSVDEVLADDPV
jgi:transposase InsO family protein